MPEFTIVSESRARETHQRTGRPIRHWCWVVLLNGEFYYVSWLSTSPYGDRPECMAFASDEHGNVNDWDELSVCYCTDPRAALSQTIQMLSAQPTRLAC